MTIQMPDWAADLGFSPTEFERLAEALEPAFRNVHNLRRDDGRPMVSMPDDAFRDFVTFLMGRPRIKWAELDARSRANIDPEASWRLSAPSQRRRPRASAKPKTLDTQAAVARHFDVNRQSVPYWLKRGMPRNKDGTFSIADVEAWRKEFKGETKPDASDPESGSIVERKGIADVRVGPRRERRRSRSKPTRSQARW